MIWPLLIAATGAASPGIVATLVDALHLDAIPELRQGADVAIIAEPAIASWVAPVEASLLALGIRTLPAEGSDAELLAAGVEWKLQLLDGRSMLVAELTEIDPGLFGQLSGPVVPRASASVPVQATAVVEPPPTSMRPRLGPLMALGALPDRVLAIEACGAPGPELLLVLTLERLYVYAIERRRLEVYAELSLESLPAAKMPTRDPIGSVVCGEATAAGILVGYGHGRAGAGGVARLDPKTAGKKRLVAIGSLAGVPLARVGGRWLIARADQGKNRWASFAWADEGASADLKVEAQWLSIAGIRDDRGVAFELLAIDPAYHLAFLDQKLAGNPSTERGGAGTAARRIGAERVVLTTSDRDGERIGLLGSATKIPIEAPVLASAILRVDGDNWLAVLAIDRDPKGSTLHVAELRTGDGP